MEVDGPLSAQEQMIILYDIKLQCQQNLSNTDPGFTGKKKKAHERDTDQLLPFHVWQVCA